MEKAVDCLRIITTGNDANKRALVEIPIALRGLMRLLAEPKAVCTVACCHCDVDTICQHVAYGRTNVTPHPHLRTVQCHATHAHTTLSVRCRQLFMTGFVLFRW